MMCSANSDQFCRRRSKLVCGSLVTLPQTRSYKHRYIHRSRKQKSPICFMHLLLPSRKLTESAQTVPSSACQDTIQPKHMPLTSAHEPEKFNPATSFSFIATPTSTDIGPTLRVHFASRQSINESSSYTKQSMRRVQRHSLRSIQA